MTDQPDLEAELASARAIEKEAVANRLRLEQLASAMKNVTVDVVTPALPGDVFKLIVKIPEPALGADTAYIIERVMAVLRGSITYSLRSHMRPR